MDWRIFSNEHRKNIVVYLLKNKELTPSALTDKLGIEGPTVSAHLKDLENAGLVSYRRVKNYKFYSINRKGLEKFHADYMKTIGDGLAAIRQTEPVQP